MGIVIVKHKKRESVTQILIFLTEEAKGLEQEYNEVTEEISNIYYKGFSEEEIEQLENYLHRILKNVEGVL